jgi:hypothetical protein
MRAWIACLVVACLAAAPAAAHAADRTPTPHPGALWQQYPLGTERLTGTTSTNPAPVAPSLWRGGRTTPGESAPNLWLPIALGAAAPLLLALAGGASLYLRLRRRADIEEPLTGPVAEIVLATARLDSRRMARRGSDHVPASHTITPNRGRREAMPKPRLKRTKTHSLVSQSENVDDRGSGQEESVQEATASRAVSDRVSEVIKAVEELAEQIRTDAHAEAAQIKSRAEEAQAAAMKRHAEKLEGLRTAAEAEAAEAAEIRRAAELYGTDHRRSAEAGTAKLLAEAEAQARAMREAAEQMAMQIETTALRRREKLEEQTSLVETRLRRFHAALREISSELEELLDPTRGKGGTLLEALSVDGEKASDEAKEETAPTHAAH